MASKIDRVLLHVPRGYRSAEVASFVAQLDDLRTLMLHDLRGVTARELEWQPKPGMNSIGMLLAHIAIVEVSWIEAAVKRVPPKEVKFHRIVGLDRDDDGMPAGPRDRHPAAIRGYRLADYVRHLRRGRENLRRAARKIAPRDLERAQRRVRFDGKVQIYNVRWVLYHLVEHFAGHYGQILLLRHQYRDRGRK